MLAVGSAVLRGPQGFALLVPNLRLMLHGSEAQPAGRGQA